MNNQKNESLINIIRIQAWGSLGYFLLMLFGPFSDSLKSAMLGVLLMNMAVLGILVVTLLVRKRRW